MAKEEQILIEVKLDAQKVAEQLGETTRQIQLLKQEQKQLDKALEEGRISEENYGKAMAENNKDMNVASRSLKGLTAQLKIAMDSTNQYGDSLNEERRKLNDMQKAYDELDASIRDSKAGKDFLKRIQKQSEAVKQMEQETGRAQRNVGNYAEALKKAGVGVDGFAGKMKALWANPWAAIIGAVVLVIKKLIDAFKSSEDRMREIQTAFAPLRGVLDMVQQLFDKLAKSLSGFVTGALQKATEGVKWLFNAIDKLASKMGLDWHLSEAFESVAENAVKATAAEQAYADRRRAWVQEEAKLDKQIAILRDKAVQGEKYSFEDRIKFMEQALEMERRKADEQVKLAKMNLAALEAEANRSENDAEMNDRLAEAKAAVTRAETEYYKKAKEINAQIVAFKKEEAAATEKANKAEEKKARDDEKEKKKEQERTKASLDYRLQVQLAALGKDKEYSAEGKAVYEQYFNDMIALYDKDSKEYFDALKNKEKYESEYAEKRKELELAAQQFIDNLYGEDEKAKYEKQLDQLEEFHAQGLLSEEEYLAAKEELNNQYDLKRAEAAVNYAQQAIGIAQTIISAIEEGEQAELEDYKKGQDTRKKELEKRLNAGEISQEQYNKEVQSIDAETAKKEKELQYEQAKREKAMAIMNATLNAAAAIIASLAQSPIAIGPIPNPAGIASLALATTMGVVQVAAAMATPLPQFESGGIVPGTSYSGDNVVARLNSGEGVLTQGGVQNAGEMLRAVDEGRVGVDYEMMAAAVAAQPAPVMVYSEFEEFGDKVSTFNEIAKV